ncbi:heavy metal translocating P-type ATPase [Lysobacter brunescens]|uniref:Heavy metal translocating P-type ATPase n=1 Tax=Lysobacter brunescens TaxID=262323 RepID=A0ABW2Y9X7_9GAMM
MTHAATCFHCGDALPPQPLRDTIAGTEQAFCCTGCAAAARWIADADLGDYYRLRQTDAARVSTEAIDYACWDRADLLAEHSTTVDGGREITVLTDGMRCAACAWLIDRALTREPGVREIAANAITGRIRIVWDDARTPLSALLSRLASLGYRPSLATGEAHEQARRRERNRWLLRLGVAGLGSMQAMMFAEALYLDTAGEMPLPTRDFFRWITFLVSTPVVFYAGWPFIEGMWRELRGRRLGMDTLIASSTLLAYFASLLETVRGGVHVWYDAAVMFVFLLLAARMLEQRARGIASAQVDALARARPALAMREREDGSAEQVPLAALAAGDVLRIAVGEAVPADGVLLDDHGDGGAAFDEALLTGESLPVSKRAGDTAYAGSLCRERPARLRVTHTGADTRLSQLVRLVERAQEQRPAIARAADRIASVFVAVLSLIALGVYLWWRVHEPARAFEVALAVLVVSCPCALSLAVPAALAAAHGALAKLGVLALRGEALDTLARADRIVFDKTGTLSDRHPRIVAIDTFGDIDRSRALAIATALERDSGHPLAAAFVEASAQEAGTSAATDARNVHASPGHGIAGQVDGRAWRLGRAAWAAAQDARGGDDEAALWLGDGQRASARFRLQETPRPEAAEALQALRAQGLSVALCSGDAEQAVARMADAVDIPRGRPHDDVHVRARQTPEDKLAYVRERQATGEIVAMVGDGINDAPVLAGADVSIALADGAALAQRAADFVVGGGDLRRIPQAVALARRSRRIVRENFAWAIGYNLLALPLAAAGMVTPWIAAVGMALSSLLVTLNALRLTRLPAQAPTDIRAPRI